jgi:hypothetical protein
MYKFVFVSMCLMMSILNPIMAASIGTDDVYTTVVENFRIEVSLDKMDHGFSIMSKITRLKNSHTVHVSMFLRGGERSIIHLGSYFRENDLPLTNLGLILIKDDKHLIIEVGHIMSDYKFAKMHSDI